MDLAKLSALANTVAGPEISAAHSFLRYQITTIERRSKIITWVQGIVLLVVPQQATLSWPYRLHHGRRGTDVRRPWKRARLVCTAEAEQGGSTGTKSSLQTRFIFRDRIVKSESKYAPMPG